MSKVVGGPPGEDPLTPDGNAWISEGWQEEGFLTFPMPTPGFSVYADAIQVIQKEPTISHEDIVVAHCTKDCGGEADEVHKGEWSRSRTTGWTFSGSVSVERSLPKILDKIQASFGISYQTSKTTTAAIPYTLPHLGIPNKLGFVSRNVLELTQRVTILIWRYYRNNRGKIMTDHPRREDGTIDYSQEIPFKTLNDKIEGEGKSHFISQVVHKQSFPCETIIDVNPGGQEKTIPRFGDDKKEDTEPSEPSTKIVPVVIPSNVSYWEKEEPLSLAKNIKIITSKWPKNSQKAIVAALQDDRKTLNELEEERSTKEEGGIGEDTLSWVLNRKDLLRKLPKNYKVAILNQL